MNDPLDFATDGAALFPGAARSILTELDTLAAMVPGDRAGVRLHGMPQVRAIAAAAPAQRIAAALIGDGAVAVRAILFDKTPGMNWSLAWHQDRTIAVRRRVVMPGYGPWSVKQGMQHVEPPFPLIERMATLRIHLDDTPIDNAPLLIAPGSHRLGRIAEADIDETVKRCGVHACLAERGDVWAYSTPILHASAASAQPHRRVLQVDFTADALPGELEWLGL